MELPYNKAANNVSQFLSVYTRTPINPSIGQQQKLQFPQILPQNNLNLPHIAQQMNYKKQTAESEFQAIWDHLQHQKLPEYQRSPPPQQDCTFNTFVNEQTNALKKILKLHGNETNSFQNSKQTEGIMLVQPSLSHRKPSNMIYFNNTDVKICNHENCCFELISLCQKYNLPYPTWKYEMGQNNMVYCKLVFGDGQDLVGPPCLNRVKAALAVACMSIRLVESKYQPMQQKKPHVLPIPPQQWCQHDTQDKKVPLPNKPPLHQKGNDNDMHPNNTFVPCQVQKNGLDSQHSNVVQVKNESQEVSRGSLVQPASKLKGFTEISFNQNSASSTPPKDVPLKRAPRRGSRLAAKFSNPIKID